MGSYVSNLHPEDNPNDTIYPNWIDDNSPRPVLYNYGTLASGSVKAIDSPGAYFLSSGNTYQDLPDNVESGVILCLTSGSQWQKYLLLIDYQNTKMYEMHQKGEAWSTWGKLVFESDLPESFRVFGTLPDGTDVYSYTKGKTGAWFLSSSLSYVNTPLGVFGGMLVAYSDPANTARQYLQIYDANSNLIYYSHTYNNDSTPWRIMTFGGVLTKVSDSKYTISNAKVVTTLERIINSAKNQDAWNITGIVKLDTPILSANSDILGPIQEFGQSDFSGGVHGHEIGTNIKIYVDGTIFTGGSTVFSTCDIYVESDIYRADEQTKTFKRHIHINFAGQKITISVGYTAINDVVVYRATNGGLYAERSNHIADIITNVDGIVGDISAYSTHWARNMVEQVFHLKQNTAKVTIRNIYGNHLSTYKGALNVFSDEKPVRYKTYMDIISATPTGTKVSAGETIYGQWELILE